jgi:hypothetical protein
LEAGVATVPVQRKVVCARELHLSSSATLDLALAACINTTAIHGKANKAVIVAAGVTY